jgi:nitric oxide synthase-interacting protein
VSNLVAQKKEIKRTSRARARLEAELHDAALQEDEQAQQSAVREFELIQAGLKPIKPSKTDQAGAIESRSGEKRKAATDEETPSEDRHKARKVLGETKVSDSLILRMISKLKVGSREKKHAQHGRRRRDTTPRLSRKQPPLRRMSSPNPSALLPKLAHSTDTL